MKSVLPFILSLALVCVATAVAAPVSETGLAALEKALEQGGGQAGSRAADRRVYKRVVREAQALLAGAPDDASRFRLLGLVFQGQKRLLAMDNTETNRKAVFDACVQLIEAPDDYAEWRLEPDLLLTEKKLSDADATLAMRAEALADLIGRYRGTRAEARSLMAASVIATKLDARKLEQDISRTLDARFPDDPAVIQFRRQHGQFGSLRAYFKGTFTRQDGVTLHFPADTLGHMCLLVFWSKDNPGIVERLKVTQAKLASYGDRLDVFSFNVDELPDGGAAILRTHGINWTVMLLPGGTAHPAYRTYAGTSLPHALVVNEYGLLFLYSGVAGKAHDGGAEATPVGFRRDRIGDARYLAHLQSILIGDFLVRGEYDASPTGTTRPPTPEGLRAIQACFPPPPFRYRLTRQEMLANYTEAATRCADILAQGGDASDLWRVRNCRIIALLGMRKLALEPTYLDEAIKEAETALTMQLPPGADVVPRFCLATAALRPETADTEAVVAAFVDACGGSDAPPMAVAAASILALHDRPMELHEPYRSRFLDAHADEPAYRTVTAFLRNRYHRFQLLMSNTSHRQPGERFFIRNANAETIMDRLPPLALKGLDGSTMTFPRSSERLTWLLFIEPSADPDADLLDRSIVSHVTSLAQRHLRDGIEVVAVFLSDDTNRVSTLMATEGWRCQAAMLPGGVTHPVVEQLGIFSADRIPNLFLLRRDGSVAWRESGLRYKGRYGDAVQLAMAYHVERCESEHGCQLLKEGRYAEAVTAFESPFPPSRNYRFHWHSPRHHGRAMAYAGMKDWAAALEAIEKAIDAHPTRHCRGRDGKPPCNTIQQLSTAKGWLLEQLGRLEDAAALKLAAASAGVMHADEYSEFHERLETWRLELHQSGHH